MIEKIRAQEFDAVFAIMERSFPSDERRPYEEQRALLREDGFDIYVERDAVAIKGFLAVWHLDGFGFIEHFAVAPDYRNGGIGSRMLQEAVTMLGGTVCLEVEPPSDELTRRRIEFYRRNGFVLNDYPYMQPPISKGKNAIPLAIMTYGNAIDAELFTHYKDTLYRRVYKCK